MQSSDIVLVFRSDRGLESIVNGKFTLGADASVAAGPVGRNASTATDGELKAEIWSWSRARGLFAGVALDGAVLAIDDAANEAVYGRDSTPRMIFEGRVPSPVGAGGRVPRCAGGSHRGGARLPAAIPHRALPAPMASASASMTSRRSPRRRRPAIRSRSRSSRSTTTRPPPNRCRPRRNAIPGALRYPVAPNARRIPMGGLSLWHWLIVLVIVVLVFGTKRLKNVGQDLGEAVKGFKKGMQDDDDSSAADAALPPASRRRTPRHPDRQYRRRP